MEFGSYSFGDHPPEKRGAEAANRDEAVCQSA